MARKLEIKVTATTNLLNAALIEEFCGKQGIPVTTEIVRTGEVTGRKATLNGAQTKRRKFKKRVRLSVDQVREVMNLKGSSRSAGQIAADYDVCSATIYSIWSGRHPHAISIKMQDRIGKTVAEVPLQKLVS